MNKILILFIVFFLSFSNSFALTSSQTEKFNQLRELIESYENGSTYVSYIDKLVESNKEETSYLNGIKNKIANYSTSNKKVKNVLGYFYVKIVVAFENSGTGISGGSESIITSRQGKIYIPEKIIWDKNKIVTVSSTSELERAVKNATKNTTIVMKNGNYKPKINLDNKHYLTIKAENKYGAKWSCYGESGCIRLSNNAKASHINILGIDASGDGGGFLFFTGNGASCDPGYFYIADCKFRGFSVTIYSGLHSHDWTVDRVVHHDSTASYLWYMMGWHHTVQNSVLYNNPYYYISMRGHYPLGEEYNYYSPSSSPEAKTRPLSDNKEWTHTIINNTFGSTSKHREYGDAQLALYYAPGESVEKYYLPPKDVLIANNVFLDNGPRHKTGINLYTTRGINTGKSDGVNGLYIYNNVSGGKLLDANGGSISLNQYGSGNKQNSKNIHFVSDSNRNYHLTSSSTDLINKGKTGDIYPKYDFDKKARKANPDVGAFEY